MMIKSEIELIREIPLNLPFPCHIQAVERAIRMVTDESLKCFGKHKRTFDAKGTESLNLTPKM